MGGSVGLVQYTSVHCKLVSQSFLVPNKVAEL